MIDFYLPGEDLLARLHGSVLFKVLVGFLEGALGAFGAGLLKQAVGHNWLPLVSH